MFKTNKMGFNVGMHTSETPQQDQQETTPKKPLNPLEKELQREGSPVSIDIFYTAHLEADDVRGLRERIEAADIFIPENIGWHKGIERDFQGVSDGRVAPETQLKEWGFTKKDYEWYDVALEELRALYDTKKKVVFVDVPEDHELAKQFEDLPRLADTMDTSTPEGKLEAFDDYLRKDAEIQEKREEYIVKHLKKELIGALGGDVGATEHPRIVMFLGSLHSSVYHALKDEYTASRQYRELPYVFDFIQEAKRRYRFRKEIDQELLMRGAVQWIAEVFVLPAMKIKRSGEPGKFHRETIGLLNVEELRAILEQPSLKLSAVKLYDALGTKLEGAKPHQSPT